MKTFLSIAIGVVLVTNIWAQSGLKMGEKAPEFTTKNQDGKALQLSKLLKTGPVVLVFYRGQWCPYCNKQLSALQDSLGMLTAKNATVIAVSPEKQESVAQTIQKTKATFNVVSDMGLDLSKKYQVNYVVTEKMLSDYKGYGVDIAAGNGMNGGNLPVPATYIISKEGKIIYAFVNADITQRASVASLLSALK